MARKSITPPKRRDAAARALAEKQFQPKAVPAAKKYQRRPKLKEPLES